MKQALIIITGLFAFSNIGMFLFFQNRITTLESEARKKYELEEDFVIKNLKCNSIEVIDNEGSIRYSIKSNNDDEILQKFFDTKGVERLQCGIAEQEISRVRLFDEFGKRRFSTSVTRTDSKNRNYALGIYNDEGRNSLVLGSFGNLNGLVLYDNNNLYRQGFGLNQDDMAFIESANSENKITFCTHTYADGTNQTVVNQTPTAWDTWSDILTAKSTFDLFK